MSRKLIDRDALIASIPKTNVDIFENCRNCSTLMDWQVKELIDNAPTIDAVEVVRCKDCKHCYAEGFVNVRNVCEKHYDFGNVDDDWFCADGERRE